MLLLASGHDPVDHVLPHTLFQLLPSNLNFGADSVFLLGFPLAKQFSFTNQLLMTLVAAGLCLLLFPWLARAYAGAPGPAAPRGRLMNLLESLLQFIREEVARPVLKHRTDRFMPFLWTLFFFILFCNLLGLVPLGEIIQLITGGTVRHVGGTATGNIAITSGLALIAFAMVHVSGIGEVYRGLLTGAHGHHGHEKSHDEPHEHADAAHAGGMSPTGAFLLALPTYLWNFAPHVFAKHGPRPRPPAALRPVMVLVAVPVAGAVIMGFFGLLAGAPGLTVGKWTGAIIGVMAGFCLQGLHWTDIVDLAMWAFLLVLEFIGAVIKPFALMIRLFANMVAGHIVLASILLLIFTAQSVVLAYTVGAISVFGCLAISCLELFVAFLQAYIFVFLTTLFISMAVAPEH
jgi:F0F1-type ATP synthase membrane subunit a